MKPYRSGPSCSEGGKHHPPSKSPSSGKHKLVLLILVHWIVIYPVDSAIQRLEQPGQIKKERKMSLSDTKQHAGNNNCDLTISTTLT